MSAASARSCPRRMMLSLGLLLCAAQVCLAQSAAATAEVHDPAVLSRLEQADDTPRSLKFFVVKVETSVQRVGVNPPR